VDINANNMLSSTGVTVHLVFTLEHTINAYVTVQQVCGWKTKWKNVVSTDTIEMLAFLWSARRAKSMKMPPATIQPPANVMLKEMDPYAGVNVSQAPRPAEHFVLMKDKIVLEKS
jgi:hypothetical protein